MLISLFLIFSKGKIYDSYNDKLKVRNLSTDTLCFWFAPIPNDSILYATIKDKTFNPSIILPNKTESYPSGIDWQEAIYKIKGGKMHLLNYGIILSIKDNKMPKDSFSSKNIVKLSFPLTINKLDSCNWVITYK